MDLTQKLKLLKNIHPQKKWLQETKGLFLMQAKKELLLRKQEGEILNFAFWKLFLKPASVLGAIAILFFSGSAMAMQATKDTLPGDPLYIIKINLEKTQKILTNNKEKKVKLAIKSSDERLKELKKLSHSISSKETEKNIKIATQNLDTGIKEIQTSLNDLKGELNSKTTVKTAKTIDEQTIKYEKELLQTKEESSSLIKEEIEKVLDSVEKTNSHAFQTIINEHKEAKEDLVLEKEATNAIENKIKQTEKKIEEVKIKMIDLAKKSESEIQERLVQDGQGGGQIDLVDQQKIEIKNLVGASPSVHPEISITEQENKKIQNQYLEVQPLNAEVEPQENSAGASPGVRPEIIEQKNTKTIKQENIRTQEQGSESPLDKGGLGDLKTQEQKEQLIQKQENKEKSKEIIKETNKAKEILKEVKESLEQKNPDKIDLNIIADKVAVSKKLVNIAEKVADKTTETKK